MLYFFYRGFQMPYIFSFVESDVFVGVVWDKYIDICFPFEVMDSIDEVYIRIFPFLESWSLMK